MRSEGASLLSVRSSRAVGGDTSNIAPKLLSRGYSLRARLRQAFLHITAPRLAMMALLAIVYLVVVAAELSTTVVAADTKAPEEGPDDLRFMVTIDAGSSGSRIHVHSVRTPHAHGSLPDIVPRFTHKVNPGLSAYATDPLAAARSIRDLLEFAMDNVPRVQWRRTPVFLKGTAGLRSVTQVQATEILDHCAEAIERTAFQFLRPWAGVISGKEEGKFGWIAVNYLMKRLGNQANANLGPVGVIEMGGASMQMSFVPPHGADVKALEGLRLAGLTYDLYTHSFLGYGLEQANEQLARQVGPDSSNPCVPMGAQERFPTAVGDFDQCAALMPKLLGAEKQCRAKSCSLDGVYQPDTTGIEFVAIENFFYTSEFFGVAGRPEELDDVARPFCKRDMAFIRSNYKADKESDLPRFCFNAAYIHAVLTTGFGFVEPFNKVSVVHKVDGVGIDWSLGSVLFEALNMPPPPSPIIYLPPPPGYRTPPSSSFPFVNLWVFVLPLAVVAIAVYLLRSAARSRSGGARFGGLPYSSLKRPPMS